MNNSELATIGGGCFWCVEAVFQRLKGVESVVSGYAGGQTENPNYQAICTGTTGHAEVVQISFDPAVISYEQLLLVFMTTHDPSTLNRQGADRGTQYRSVIYYHHEAQKATAEQVLKELAPHFDHKIVTELAPLPTFYKAEAYHQNYYNNNKFEGYCRVVIDPKVAKLRSLYADFCTIIADPMHLNIQDTFPTRLPADADTSNTRRQVSKACFSYTQPRKPSAPVLMHYSPAVLSEIGLEPEDAHSAEFLEVFSGAKVVAGTRPFAMCYGGHQFGHWAGQLGDGRAINLFEVVHQSKRWALQLKGAGETPYSRNADGLAVLRSSVREHLCSEAMYHLGVPTTRSLSLVRTGDEVLRDVMYNGNAAYENGAVVCRVAPSFIRFGNFEILAARRDLATLKALTDYTITYFYPHIPLTDEKAAYLQFFSEVIQRTVDMIVHWQRVGFVHGVMNTDNMSILGLTIDYGPYGWLEGYEAAWTPNTTDAENRRYRFGNQPFIGLWNLVQLGNSLYPLIEDIPAMEEALNTFNSRYQQKYWSMMRQKIGLETELPEDQDLLEQLLKALELEETDMTIFFRNLASIQKHQDTESAIKHIQSAFYTNTALTQAVNEAWQAWFAAYLQRLQSENRSDEARKIAMNVINPKYVLRNYMAQIAIDKADAGDYTVIEELYQLLRNPYDEQPEHAKWFSLRPDWARTKVGCSMLSCSS